MIWSVAMAQTAGEAAKGPNIFETMFPFLAILAVFYFLVSRPQQKKAQQHKDFVSGLKKGDEVVTSSGIIGQITGVTDLFVTLEISDGVRIKILRSQIANSMKNEAAAT